MLDRNSPVPMYHQVKDEMIGMIRQGFFQVGDKVYSESEICQKYGVSAITAKRVLNELAQEGYIARQPGRGSFVTHKEPISHVLSHFYSFTDEVRRRGMTPSHKLLRLEEVDPPAECAAFFGLGQGQKVLLVQRHRFADGELIALDHSFLHGSLAPRLTWGTLAATPLYEALSGHGLVPDKAVESFDAAALDLADAELLEMKPGTAVLKVSRQTYSSGWPMEYNFRYYKPNKYIYRIELDLGR